MGTLVRTGAICGTFLCGARKAGEMHATAPFAKPKLELVPRSIYYFLVPPVRARMGKPILELHSRPAQIAANSSPRFQKPVLLLVARAMDGYQPVMVSMAKPVLELVARHLNLAVGQNPQFRKAILELVARPASALVPILIPTDEADWILEATEEFDGSLLLTPVVEEELLLVPTSEAVG